jgi:hypothetical protein
MKKTDKILLASMLQQQRLRYKSHLQKSLTYYLEHSQLGLDGKRFELKVISVHRRKDLEINS